MARASSALRVVSDAVMVWWLTLLLVLCSLAPCTAFAQTAAPVSTPVESSEAPTPESSDADLPEPAAEDPRSAEARRLFRKGVELSDKMRWSEALQWFLESAELRPAPITHYNIGRCALIDRRNALASDAMRAALSLRGASPKEPQADWQSRLESAKGVLETLDDKVALLPLEVKPSGWYVAVDELPLTPSLESANGATYVAGVPKRRAPGVAPTGTFTVLLDPGRHVLTFTKPGNKPRYTNIDVVSGENPKRVVDLNQLPATLQIHVNAPGAAVSLDGAAIAIVGQEDNRILPVTIRRGAGTYRVNVHADGYEEFEGQVTLQPGEQQARFDVRLEPPPEKDIPWLWFAAGIVTVGTIVYFTTREEPPPKPFDGGSTGWVVNELRF